MLQKKILKILQDSIAHAISNGKPAWQPGKCVCFLASLNEIAISVRFSQSEKQEMGRSLMIKLNFEIADLK